MRNLIAAAVMLLCVGSAYAEPAVTLRKPGSSASNATTGPSSKPVGRYLDTARLAPGEMRESKNRTTASVGGLAWDPTGRYLLEFDRGGYTGAVNVLNAGSFAIVRKHVTHKGTVRDARFTREGKFALTASADKTAQTWNIVTGQVEQVFSGHAKAVNTAVFDATQTKVLTASDDGNAILWDRVGGTQLNMFQGNTKSPLISAFFVGGGKQIVTVSSDGAVKVWDIATAALVSNQQIAKKIANADISPDGFTLVTSANDKIVRSTDLRGGQTRVLNEDKTLFTSDSKVRFSPDGKMLGISGSDSVLVLSAADGAPLDRFNSNAPPSGVSFASMFGLTQATEFTFAVDSLTLIVGPVPYPDPNTNQASSSGRYVEWRPEF